MIRNYLRSAWRSFCRHKGHSFINLAGFALGMSCCVAILLYVRNERSYDAYHKDVERVFRISMDIRNKASSRLFAPISDTAGPALGSGYPQVEAVARVWPRASRLVRRDDIVSYEDLFMFADARFFDVLTIPLVLGDPRMALTEPGSLVITEALARKYFGAEDPMGRVLSVNGRDFAVMGVAANLTTLVAEIAARGTPRGGRAAPRDDQGGSRGADAVEKNATPARFRRETS